MLLVIECRELDRCDLFRPLAATCSRSADLFIGAVRRVPLHLNEKALDVAKGRPEYSVVADANHRCSSSLKHNETMIDHRF